MKNIIFIILVISLCFSPLFAAEATTTSVEFDSSLGRVQTESDNAILSVGQLAKGIMIGLAVSGATMGIGALVASTSEGVARQPEASSELTKIMNSGIYACVGLAVGTIAVSFFF